MSARDLVYVGHMLDMARKAVTKTQGISRETYDADENLRFALISSTPTRNCLRYRDLHNLAHSASVHQRRQQRFHRLRPPAAAPRRTMATIELAPKR